MIEFSIWIQLAKRKIPKADCMPELITRPARASDIPEIVRWARSEEFAPVFGDVDIYRTDRQARCLDGLS